MIQNMLDVIMKKAQPLLLQAQEQSNRYREKFSVYLKPSRPHHRDEPKSLEIKIQEAAFVAILILGAEILSLSICSVISFIATCIGSMALMTTVLGIGAFACSFFIKDDPNHDLLSWVSKKIKPKDLPSSQDPTSMYQQCQTTVLQCLDKLSNNLAPSREHHSQIPKKIDEKVQEAAFNSLLITAGGFSVAVGCEAISSVSGLVTLSIISITTLGIAALATSLFVHEDPSHDLLSFLSEKIKPHSS